MMNDSILSLQTWDEAVFKEKVSLCICVTLSASDCKSQAVPVCEHGWYLLSYCSECYFTLLFHSPHCAACGILAPWPGIEPRPWQWSPNHWTAREFPECYLILLFKIFFNISIYLFIYLFWLRWVFIAARGLSLVAASRDYSLLWYAGFSLRWLLLLWSTGSRHMGFSNCSTQASVVVAHRFQ